MDTFRNAKVFKNVFPKVTQRMVDVSKQTHYVFKKTSDSFFHPQESPLALRDLGNHLRHTHGEATYNCIGISGFTSKGSNLITTWQPLCDVFPNANSYALEWEAGNTLRLGLYLSSAFLNSKLLSVLPDTSKKKVAETEKPLGVASHLDRAFDQLEAGFFSLSGSLKNFVKSWEKAQKNADEAGEMLAQEIAFGNLGEKPLVLVGTDLGSEVIISTLKYLGRDNCTNKVRHVILLGSTIVYDQSLLSSAFKVVSGKVVNVFSSRDLFLAYLAFRNEYTPLLGTRSVENDFVGAFDKDMTEDLGFDHFKYARDLDKILSELQSKYKF